MGQDAVKRKDEELTGRNLPNADGAVSDEDVKAIDDRGEGRTGQDHSLDNYGRAAPDEGVGAVQNANDTTSDIAHIVD